MTIPPRPSARPSVRPLDGDDPYTEFSALYTRTGPESIPPLGSVAPRQAERSKRVSGQRLARLDERLSPRDRALLIDVERFGFLATIQIVNLHFADAKTPSTAARLARRHLQQLAADGLVESLARRVGGPASGSDSNTWRIGPAGLRLLRADPDTPRLRYKQPSPRFLDHRLTVADCYLSLVELTRVSTIELLTFATEPSSWRSYLSPMGAPATLKPDAYVVTAASGYEDHWYLEIDRSTESLPTIVKQCLQYEDYRRSGADQRDLGLFPRVVWVVPDEPRRQAIARTIAATDDLSTALYTVTTVDSFSAVIEGGAA